MAQAAATLEEDFGLVFSRYLRGLARHPSPSATTSPGHDVRICAACGERAPFALDPEGTWYRCHHCGEYA